MIKFVLIELFYAYQYLISNSAIVKYGIVYTSGS